VHYDFFFQLSIVRDFGMLSEMSENEFCTHSYGYQDRWIFNSCGLHACVDWRASCRTRCATRQVAMKDSSPEAGKILVV
jgi:hypothetical protein